MVGALPTMSQPTMCIQYHQNLSPIYNVERYSSYVISWVLDCTSYVMSNISYATLYATSHTIFDCFALGIRFALFRAGIQAAFGIAMFLLQCTAHKSSTQIMLAQRWQQPQPQAQRRCSAPPAAAASAPPSSS